MDLQPMDPQPTKRLGGEAGLTLIETLIAMVVLAFGLVAVTNLFIVATAANASGSIATISTNIASEQLDVLRTMSASTLAPGGSLTVDVGPPGLTCPAVNPGEFYCFQDAAPGSEIPARVHLQWTIAPVGGAAAANAVAITLQATPVMAFGLGGSGQVVLTTIRTCTAAPLAGGGGCTQITFP